MTPLPDLQALSGARRILVVGSPGSGKSWLAARLGSALGHPAHHLDEIHFLPAWGVRPAREWDALLDALCAGPSWVIDGNFPASLPRRLDTADALVVLDRAPVACLAGFLRRVLGYLVGPYGALPAHMRLPGGRRRVTARPLRFAVFILRFRRRTLAPMLALAGERPGLLVVRVRSRRQVAGLLTGVAAARARRSGGHCRLVAAG